MEGTIIERDGRLFIQDPWENNYFDPIRYRHAWPTGVSAKDYPELIGLKVCYCGNGLYSLPNQFSGQRRYIALEYRGKTKPDQRYTETEPIPKPRWRKDTGVYKNGEWHKY